MHEPSISVIIPAFNCAEFIVECLESVARQSLTPDEVIVIDDWSNDDTFEAVGRYGEENPDFPLRLLRAPQGHLPGPGAVRNSGLHAARGEWIAFLDADDIWHREHLARAIDAIRRFPDLVAYYCRGECFDNGSGEKMHYVADGPAICPTPFDASQLMLGKCAATTPGVVARLQSIKAVGMFDQRLLTAQDWWLWIGLAKVGAFYYDSRVGCFVRMYPQSHTLGGNGPRPMLTGPAFAVVVKESQLLSQTEKRTLVRYWLSRSEKRLQHYVRTLDLVVLGMVASTFWHAGRREKLNWFKVGMLAFSGLAVRMWRLVLVRMRLISKEQQFVR